jgi:hypothetical protein
MTGVIGGAVLSAVLGVTMAVCVARAGIPPDPCGLCTFPAYVDLGACDVSGQPDTTVTFRVRLRDIGNFPLVNYPVTCTFDSDVRIYNLTQGLVSCQCVEIRTDVNGIATFCVPGAGRNTDGGASFTGASAAMISVGNCGSPIQGLGTAHVATYDENGGVTTKGVEVTDLAAWGADYYQRLAPGRPFMYRSDFSHNGTLEVLDLAKWGTMNGRGKSKFSCGTFCP